MATKKGIGEHTVTPHWVSPLDGSDALDRDHDNSVSPFLKNLNIQQNSNMHLSHFSD